MKSAEEWARDLFPRAQRVFEGLEVEALVLFDMNKRVPEVELSEVPSLWNRFAEILDEVGTGQSVNSPERNHDFKMDVLVAMYSQKISEIAQSVHSMIEFAGAVDDGEWMKETLDKYFAMVVYHVSSVAALTSSSGLGFIHPGPLTDLYCDNNNIIGHAFLSQDDGLINFLKRTHSSDLSHFAGSILAFANVAEEFIYGKRTAEDVDGDHEYRASALRDVLAYSEDLPEDFWSAYFECVYLPVDPGSELKGHAGTFEWALDRGEIELYGELSQRFPPFLDALLGEGNFRDPTVVIKALASQRPATPDLTL